MTTVSTEFTAPCTQDRAILAVQDLANSLQWPILELATSRVVLTGPKLQPLQMYDFPQISILLQEDLQETRIRVIVSVKMPSIDFGGVKKKLTGIMGQVVNGLSVRIQTKSIAINPTVALGEGQGEAQSEIPVPNSDRLSQLERLQKLLESGILTREEFDAEKQKILRGA
jgi:hypothetical protein